MAMDAKSPARLRSLAGRAANAAAGDVAALAFCYRDGYYGERGAPARRLADGNFKAT